MNRNIAGATVFAVAFAAFLVPGQTAVPNTLAALLPEPQSPTTIDGLSARLVADLNAAAETPEAEIVARAATQTPETMDDGTYVVQPGDSLYSIALRVFGTTRAHEAILAENSDRIPDAGRLPTGLVLVLPEGY